MIPVSTALSDPKWYNPKGKNTAWVDKRGVLNGLNCAELAPGPICSGLCDGKCDDKKPESCAFLKVYRLQLENNFDLENFLQRCKDLEDYLQCSEELTIVLMVHEAADNPCSERAAIQDYFTSHGIECKELEYPL